MKAPLLPKVDTQAQRLEAVEFDANFVREHRVPLHGHIHGR